MTKGILREYYAKCKFSPLCPPWWYYAEVNAHYILMSRDHHDYHLRHLSMCTVVQVYIWGLLPSELFEDRIKAILKFIQKSPLSSKLTECTVIQFYI